MDFGWRAHDTAYRYHAMELCTRSLYIRLINDVIPINLKRNGIKAPFYTIPTYPLFPTPTHIILQNLPETLYSNMRKYEFTIFPSKGKGNIITQRSRSINRSFLLNGTSRRASHVRIQKSFALGFLRSHLLKVRLPSPPTLYRLRAPQNLALPTTCASAESLSGSGVFGA